MQPVRAHSSALPKAKRRISNALSVLGGLALAIACNGSVDSGASDAGENGGSSGSGGSTGGSASAGGSAGIAGGAAGTGASGGKGGTGAAGGAGGSGGGTVTAKALAQRLGRSHFLIGMGNDLAQDHNNDGAYTLGVTLDLHDVYLVGLKGQNGWPDWNAGGTFVNILSDTAKKHGAVPMFTLYSMAGRNENNMSVLTDDTYMKPYWEAAKLLFQRLAIYNQVAIVHFEPDFWAFVQHQAGGDPTKLAVHVKSGAPDCADQPDTVAGMGKCLVALGRKYAPKVVLAFHASVWAGTAAQTVSYLQKVGAGDTEMIVVDMLDRDAGCFEAHLSPECTRTEGGWYWDETNKSSPNFHEHLAWAEAIGQGLGKPVLWWQLPFGVPSATPGGTPGHFRDNRVKYVFEHIGEFIAAGGVGAAFGVGAGRQTYIDSDGGQFKNAVTKYFAAPSAL